MEEYINSEYPDISYLRAKAKKRIPGFAFDYLDGGCNTEVNKRKNTEEIRELELRPYYLRELINPNMEVDLFGKKFSAPFGISPIGLQGLMWPRATEILAKSAFDYNIPFILSTVATASLEKVSEITEGNAWFQLYHPAEADLRDDILDRAEAAGYPVLVLLSDVPSFGYRSKEIKNGLAIPPKMSLRNILQIMGCPNWAIHTLLAGTPEFKTLKPYIPKGMSLKHLGQFMNRTFDGRLDEERIKAIRDKWKGKLVLKGVTSEEDAEKCVKLGIDGIIVSNHGGRQLDHGESAIKSLGPIVEKFRGQIKVMMDSGIQTGPDIASSLAAGAEFTFLGRSFMYGVAALGSRGGDHTISILKKQLKQVMDQVCCARPEDFPDFLIRE
ncbi:alpha-hydroxy acid oxidase [Reichenbachiella ulvae]|uniref:Alpha-hydroxy-acid oxidizing protein n=1 Tax=Reichenbachiella ulvae TaxID=2980104 RepID=A0ABT3CSG9_9BACT|nr:alpha-hydroxy acid oxidase [Reichenbachiella ulvae]MCV9386628.1 alpha-hydroxy-acid oxidizing protein [Reichenbachiella ulvae]